jgi:sugar lactone lactonase YvrE
MKKHRTDLFVLFLSAILLAGCATPATPTEAPPRPTQAPTQTAEEPSPTQEEPIDEPTQTPQPTPAAPAETDVTIDGDPGDWAGYEPLLTDPEGDHEGGGFDVAALRAFSNDQFLYVLIETHQPPTDYVQVDLEASAGGRVFIISFRPQEFSSGFMGDVTGGPFEEIGDVVGSKSAAAEAVEFKMPLSAFEDASKLTLSVRPMGGECCEYPAWYAIDEVQRTSVARVNEKEPVAETPAVPQVCADNVAPPTPFGSFEPAPIELLEEGYAAEWFVAPGAFSMPEEILLAPDGEILVYAVRSHTLSRVSLDGAVSQLAKDVYGYLGDVDAGGNVYLHMHPSGTVTRISPQGVQTVIAQSSHIQTACDSGFGFGPDGDLYVAVSRCADKADLFQITTTGRMNWVAEVPQIQVLRTSPDGRFLAATYDTVYELSLGDYTLSMVSHIPGGDISPGGLAVDDDMNIYVSTGARSRGGKLFRLPLDDPQTNAEVVAEIPGEGLSGIEWLPSSGEIIGGQIRQGSVLAVSPSGEIREIVKGNGIVTPMGIGFSPCGELAVPNDEGGLITKIDPSGQVSWLVEYISFIPPFPFVAFDPDGTLYASEAAPGLFPVRVAELPQGGALKTLVDADYPCGLARRVDGVLFVSETAAGKITKVHPDGSTEALVAGLAFPQALALDQVGNLYAVTGPAGFTPDPTVAPAPQSGDRVVRISPDGEVTDVAYLPGAAGLAVSPQGDLFVSVSTMGGEVHESRIVAISREGNQTTFASGFEDAIGLAFDLAGNLYISDEHANGIARIGGFPQGTLSGSIADESGTPIEGARVQVLSLDPIVVGQVVFTDENGHFSLPAAPRIYRVTVAAEGHETAEFEGIEVTAGQETTIEVGSSQ